MFLSFIIVAYRGKLFFTEPIAHSFITLISWFCVIVGWNWTALQTLLPYFLIQQELFVCSPFHDCIVLATSHSAAIIHASRAWATRFHYKNFVARVIICTFYLHTLQFWPIFLLELFHSPLWLIFLPRGLQVLNAMVLLLFISGYPFSLFFPHSCLLLVWNSKGKLLIPLQEFWVDPCYAYSLCMALLSAFPILPPPNRDYLLVVTSVPSSTCANNWV